MLYCTTCLLISVRPQNKLSVPARLETEEDNIQEDSIRHLYDSSHDVIVSSELLFSFRCHSKLCFCFCFEEEGVDC